MGTNLLNVSKAMIEYLARGIEFSAALIVTLATLEPTIKSHLLFLRRNAPLDHVNAVRLTLGRWLAVALDLSWQQTY
jgi:uncharacterized membrane protein